MNVLQRIRCIVRGKTRVLLDDLEQTEEQLAVLVNELDGQVGTLQKAVARAMADEKQLRMDIEDHLTEAAEWEQRVILALESGDEELAQQALLKKEEHDVRSVSLRKVWRGRKAATARLKVSLQAAQQRTADAKRKYTQLLAQYETAETTKKMHESLSGTCRRSPLPLMDKLSERIRQIEAETKAALELSGDVADSSFEARFADLEQPKRSHEHLEELKSKLARHRGTDGAAGKSPA